MHKYILFYYYHFFIILWQYQGILPQSCSPSSCTVWVCWCQNWVPFLQNNEMSSFKVTMRGKPQLTEEIPLCKEHVSKRQTSLGLQPPFCLQSLWPSCFSSSLFNRASACHLKTPWCAKLLEISPHQGNDSACQPEKPMFPPSPDTFSK